MMLEKLWKSTRYDRLALQDNEAETNSSDDSRESPGLWSRSTFWRRLGLVFIAIVAVSLVTIASDAIYDNIRHHNNIQLHCGTTVEQAKSRNCIYDIMANAWTPQKCYFPSLAQEFLALPNSTWFYDEAHTRLIPRDVLRNGDIEVLYPHETHHDRHCLYTWRKLSIAAELGTLVDTEAGSVPHTTHCVDYMARMGDHEFAKPVETRRKFIGCSRLGV